MTEEQKPKTLQELVIESIKETNLRILEEPFIIEDETFYSVVGEYLLTQKNIKQIIQIDCQHKEKEEWLDVYIIEYNEGKISKDYPRIITKQEVLEEKPKQEFGTLKFLVKDNYVLIMRSNTKETKDEVEKVFKNLKKVGLKEVKLSYELV